MPAPDPKEFDEFNQAKRLAWSHCADVVKFLVGIVSDAEQDIDLRVTAAAELLAFCNRGTP